MASPATGDRRVGYKAEVRGGASSSAGYLTHRLRDSRGDPDRARAKAGKLTARSDRRSRPDGCRDSRFARSRSYKAQGIRRQRGHSPHGREAGLSKMKTENDEARVASIRSARRSGFSADRPRWPYSRAAPNLCAAHRRHGGADPRARVIAGCRFQEGGRSSRRQRGQREERRPPRGGARQAEGDRPRRLRPGRLHLPREGPRPRRGRARGGIGVLRQ